MKFSILNSIPFLLVFLFITQCSWVDDLLNESDSRDDIQTYGASVCDDRPTGRGEVIKDQISDQEMDQAIQAFRKLNGDNNQVSFGLLSKERIQDPEVRALITDLAASAVAQSNTIGAKDGVLSRRLDTGYYEDLYVNMFSNMAKGQNGHACYFLNYIYQYSFNNNLKQEDRDFKTRLELTTFSATTGGQITCELLDKAVEELQQFIFCNDERELPSTGGGSWDDDD